MWLPIDSAPLETAVLVWSRVLPDGVNWRHRIAYNCARYGWKSGPVILDVSHWMPLPEPPESGEGV